MLLFAGLAIPLLAILGVAIIALSRGVPTASPSQAQSALLPLTGHWVPTALQNQVTALLLAPRQPSLLLAATTSGVWRSANAGNSWQPDGSGLQGRPIFVLAGAPTSSEVWAGSFDGSVYVRSAAANEQVVWRRISPVLLTTPGIGPVAVYSLAVLPDRGNTLLAGSQDAVFRGEPTGDGRTWRWQRTWTLSPVSGSGAGAVTSLLVAPWDPHLVFASIFGATPAVLVSHDAGRTWQGDTRGLPPSVLPNQDLEPGDPQARQIYLTTMGGGVWQRSADGSWRDIGRGLPQRHAMPLLRVGAPGASVLYAGTMGLGVYENEGTAPWRHLGRGLDGSAGIVLALIETTGSHHRLLAGTTHGVYRYVSPG